MTDYQITEADAKAWLEAQREREATRAASKSDRPT
jgi:hypothetical protein